MTIQVAWDNCKTMIKQGENLNQKGDELYKESKRLIAQGKKIIAQGKGKTVKLLKDYLEGEHMVAEGDRLWAKSNEFYSTFETAKAKHQLDFLNIVLKEKGDVEVKWNNDSVIIAGVEYK